MATDNCDGHRRQLLKFSIDSLMKKPCEHDYFQLNALGRTIKFKFGSRHVRGCCYIVELGLNCKFIDLLFKRSVIKFIKISSLVGFIVSKIIYSQTDTLTEELMDLR